MIPITADTSTVNPTLCKYTLSGCYIAPIVEEEASTSTSSDGSSGGSSSGGGSSTEADTTKPIITLVGDATVNLTVGDSYTDAGATANDAEDGILTNIAVSGDTVDTSTEGTYTITYDVTDSAGNSATQVTRTVIVTAATGDCPDGSSFITHNGFDYCPVTSPHTTKVWLDRNLGVARVCEALDDVACYGDFYQWGRNADGHQDSASGTIATLSTNVSSAGTEFITNGSSPSDWASVDSDGAIRIANWSVCPTGYSVPTRDELTLEMTGGDFINSATAFASFLKLLSAGYRDGSSGSLVNQGSYGDLWSATVVGSSSWYLDFGSSGADWYNGTRANGQAVRCLRD